MTSDHMSAMPARTASPGPESTLVLVRHGESEGNRDDVFTGWLDKDLTPRGVEEAHAAARLLRQQGFRFGSAYASALKRATRSAQIILEDLGQDLPVTTAEALNERNYGELSGMNKSAARERWGADQVQVWRRSYDVAPPGGESLRDTAARVLPYYIHHLLPVIMSAGPVLVVAHGNSLRALVMALDGLEPAEIPAVEIATGEILIYRLRANTSVAEKIVRHAAPPDEQRRAGGP